MCSEFKKRKLICLRTQTYKMFAVVVLSHCIATTVPGSTNRIGRSNLSLVLELGEIVEENLNR